MRDTGSAIEIDFDPAATSPQRAAAQALLNGWDFSSQAEADRDLFAKRADAEALFDNLDDGLRMLLRANAELVLDQINVIRSRAGLSTVSMDQYRAALVAKIATLGT